jgi:hypothetical protein
VRPNAKAGEWLPSGRRECRCRRFATWIEAKGCLTALKAPLFVFGTIFAANSGVHSYLILAYSENDRATMNVGFYYMANAGWRLIGTVLSGLLYELGGLESRPADTLALAG